MSQTNSNVVSGVNGNQRFWSCDFTTAAGDSSLSFVHGFNHLVDSHVSFEKGGIGTATPKVTHSSGTATVAVDDTQGYSGHAYFMGG